MRAKHFIRKEQGISKDAETKFHKKLDKLVHDTFGKRPEEMKEGWGQGQDRVTLPDEPANYYHGKGQLSKEYNELYAKLVPSQGPADTIEGEVLRAASKIVYRHYNDGDEFNEASFKQLEEFIGKVSSYDDLAHKATVFALAAEGEYHPNHGWDSLDVMEYGPEDYDDDYEEDDSDWSDDEEDEVDENNLAEGMFGPANYKGWKYSYDVEEYDDNRKIFHTVTKDGKEVSMDWSPYSKPTDEEFKLWIDLGMPTREDVGSVGPLDKDDLMTLAKTKQGTHALLQRESRGHKIIANKLKTMDRLKKGISDEEWQAHQERMKKDKEEYLKKNPESIYKKEVTEKKTKQRLDPKCWKGYKKQGTKMKGGVRVNNCVPMEENSVTDLKDLSDYEAKKKALQDLQLDPNTHKDPELSTAVMRRLAGLEKQKTELK